jgi:hypothetical protein
LHDPDTYPDSNADAHGYSYAHGYSNTDTNGNPNAYGYPNSDANCDAYC